MAEIRQELLDELLADYDKPEDLVGPDGLLKDLFKRLIETAAGASVRFGLSERVPFEVVESDALDSLTVGAEQDCVEPVGVLYLLRRQP